MGMRPGIYAASTANGDYAEKLIWGCAMGDALGAPVEFMPIGADYTVRGMDDYTGAPTPPIRPHGTYTDDTAMALCIADAIIASDGKGPDGYPGVDAPGIMRRFSGWLNSGLHAPTGMCDDVGYTCREAIDNFDAGCPQAATPGGGWGRNYRDSHSNGNGSLMRMAPVIALCVGVSDPRERTRIVREAGATTHAHPRSVLGCLIMEEYCRDLIIRAQRLDYAARVDTIANVMDRLRHELSNDTGTIDLIREFPEYEPMTEPDFAHAEVHGSGYVVNTLLAAMQSIIANDGPRTAMLQSVHYGRDNDTIGAVCGTIAAVAYDEPLPQDWLAFMRDSLSRQAPARRAPDAKLDIDDTATRLAALLPVLVRTK